MTSTNTPYALQLDSGERERCRMMAAAAPVGERADGVGRGAQGNVSCYRR